MSQQPRTLNCRSHQYPSNQNNASVGRNTLWDRPVMIPRRVAIYGRIVCDLTPGAPTQGCYYEQINPHPITLFSIGLSIIQLFRLHRTPARTALKKPPYEELQNVSALFFHYSAVCYLYCPIWQACWFVLSDIYFCKTYIYVEPFVSLLDIQICFFIFPNGKINYMLFFLYLQFMLFSGWTI